MKLFAAGVTGVVLFKAHFGINGERFHSRPDGLLKSAVRPPRLFEFTSGRHSAERFASRGHTPRTLATVWWTAPERPPSLRPHDPVGHQPLTLLKYHDGASCLSAKYAINLQDRIGACLVESPLKLGDHRTGCTKSEHRLGRRRRI
jgi:hypothetical protein